MPLVGACCYVEQVVGLVVGAFFVYKHNRNFNDFGLGSVVFAVFLQPRPSYY